MLYEMYYLFYEWNIESIFYVYVRVWDREWDKQTDRQTERDAELQAEIGRQTERGRQSDWEWDKQTDRQTEGESFQWRSLIPHPTHGYASSVLQSWKDKRQNQQ